MLAAPLGRGALRSRGAHAPRVLVTAPSPPRTCSVTKIDMSETPEPFNGAELSESVLARDWTLPEEDAAWADL